ncbi:MAG: cytochrome P450, partial [Cyanobacteria bacterium P01_F01_bin.86]
EFFTEKAVLNYHPAIVQLTQRLLEQWRHHINVKKDETHIELCQSFNALFLDIVTQITVGQSVGALDSQADGFLESLTYILKASTQPQHQFISWWRFLPLPQNHRLSQALKQVDDFLEQLITQHQNTKAITKATEEPGQVTILDKLLQNATETGATETGAIETSATETSAISSDIDTSKNPLTHAEIKDNLLAIIGNGYETVATTLTMTLQALAQHPSTLALARQEAQEVIERHHHQLTPEAVGELSYIESVLYESMRLYPAVAGLQRISRAPDILEGWSIPAQQVVGITLQPLHLDPEYYGKSPETFRPERYLTERLEATLATSCCPFKRLIQLKQPSSKNQAQQQPLTFGYGARQCLAKHLALYEMKVVLAMVLNDFYFELTSDTPTELELGKFGLFISAFPKTEIKMKVYPLPPNVKEEVDFSSLCYGLSSECEQNRNSPERALAGM